MNAILRTILGLSISAGSILTCQARVERVVEKTFNVSGNGSVRLETQSGEIRSTPGEVATVKIVARQKIRANSEAEADALLKNLSLDFEQNGNEVKATAHYEDGPAG